MKRGFTLIELLAVIVILAIIALIAVPKVLNIINDSKDSSVDRSIDLYMDTVQKTITRESMKTSYNPDRCEIQSNGNLKCYKDNEIIKTSKGNDELEVEMKGERPTSGTINFNDNKISYTKVVLDSIEYEMTEKGVKSSKKYEPQLQEPVKTIITFIYNGVEFQAEEGMTWEDFLESDYNTEGANFLLRDDLENYPIEDIETYEYISLSDEIRNGAEYFQPSGHSG